MRGATGSALLGIMLAGTAIAAPPIDERSRLPTATGAIVTAQAASGSAGADDSKRRPGDVFRDMLADGGECASCPEMVVLPAGSFVMGSPMREAGRFDNEGPQRQVSIRKRLAVSRYEVTFQEWDACVAGGGCNGHRAADGGYGRGRLPVINVGFDDAQAYVDWLKQRTGKAYRLLSEAEWEYAARSIADGRTGPRYYWGDGMQAGLLNCKACGAQGDGVATVVGGEFAPNLFGLHDMLGNVAEWVADPWHDNYQGAPTDGSVWAEGGDQGKRVLRGGSWRSVTREVRVASRAAAPRGERSDVNGIRVARVLDQP